MPSMPTTIFNTSDIHIEGGTGDTLAGWDNASGIGLSPSLEVSEASTGCE